MIYVDDLHALMDTFHSNGVVAWLSIRPAREQAVTIIDQALAIEGRGLEGDHYSAKNGKRQVTLIQGEHLDAVKSMLKMTALDPSLTRRNIVVRGINLTALKGKKFKIGESLFEYTGECHPCSRMEENLGRGGYNAMRGHGGITAKIVKSGKIKIGDAVCAITGS